MSGIFPFLIPIIALSIPIVAIIANAATRKYKAAPEEQQEFREYVKKLERRVLELEETVHTMSGSIEHIETDQRFISRLLENKRDDSPDS